MNAHLLCWSLAISVSSMIGPSALASTFTLTGVFPDFAGSTTRITASSPSSSRVQSVGGFLLSWNRKAVVCGAELKKISFVRRLNGPSLRRIFTGGGLARNTFVPAGEISPLNQCAVCPLKAELFSAKASASSCVSSRNSVMAFLLTRQGLKRTVVLRHDVASAELASMLLIGAG